LALAHDAALARLIDALYLIFKLAIARRQSLDHNVYFVRDVQANRVRRKQPLADLEFVMRHDANLRFLRRPSRPGPPIRET
jgi:hypothetical protein